MKKENNTQRVKEEKVKLLGNWLEEEIKKENTQLLKRTVGVLTAPISGSLSKKMKDKIFGSEYQGGVWEISFYGTSVAEHISDAISIGTNFVTPILIAKTYSNPEDIPKLLTYYGIYKGLESVYRLGQKIFSEGNTCSGSIEGTLISKLFIEPFLKKEEK